MSDQKLVSPLLDGYLMGDPISSHDGVSCCPAIKENSDKKYIVKILSIPSSQKQLDALLLTGAYKDAAAALEYFKYLTDNVVREAELLQQLAKLEGFLPCENWQVVPMENNALGYEVYLLIPYRQSLAKLLKNSPMTHLGAVNLGLDLCSALAACRRAGYLYVDLKPSNIFVTDDREYRIGDLGFVSMDSLPYTSMPTKYCSPYTAPELHDVLNTVNNTADIYALGLILYQVYNNGELPFSDIAPKEDLPSPVNADYEMAEIIQKALAPDPKDRWQDPAEMGQALVGYMQRNVINDTPLVPPILEPVNDEGTEIVEDAEEGSEELPLADETTPDEELDADLSEAELTEEASSMLAQAEELAAHEIPEPVIVPEPVEVTMPSLFAKPSDEQDDPDGTETTGEENEPSISFFDDEEDDDENNDHIFVPVRPKKPRFKITRGMIAGAIVIVLLALAAFAGYYYYDNYYILSVERVDLEGSHNEITALISSEIDETMLTAVCTDTYGNAKTSAVLNGKAVFSDLTPGTQYTVTLEVEGFHKLQGSTSGTYTTAQQTNIVSFTATIGPEDGSVRLNFTVDGTDPQEWVVEYSTPGEETQSVPFSGHMVTITGLTPGNVYTFRLLPAPDTELYITGTDTLEFTASKIIIAENLTITSSVDGTLTAAWDTPEGAAVSEWSVRCYSNSDDSYDTTLTVTDNTVSFSGIEADRPYTVEVTAAGMPQSARTDITANPITISNITGTTVGAKTLRVTWDYQGNAPEGGWVLSYSIDGGNVIETLLCDKNSKDISLLVPNATYNITILAADSTTVFGGTGAVKTSAAAAYYGHSLHVRHVDASLCVTPEKDNWTYRDVPGYATTFTSGQSISIVLYSSVSFYYDNDDTDILFVIRDADGNVRSELLEKDTQNWRKMWTKRYCYLTIPNLPTEAGDYAVEVYFDGAHVLAENFTITE